MADIILTYADVRAAAHEAVNSLQGALRDLTHSLSDLRAMVQGVKNDTAHIGEVHAHASSASRNTMAFQPLMQRLESQLQHVQTVSSQVNQLATSHSDLHMRVQNIEQLVAAMGTYLTSLQTQVGAITTHLGIAPEQSAEEQA